MGSRRNFASIFFDFWLVLLFRYGIDSALVFAISTNASISIAKLIDTNTSTSGLVTKITSSLFQSVPVSVK
jgi:hypothetical protein